MIDLCLLSIILKFFKDILASFRPAILFAIVFFIFLKKVKKNFFKILLLLIIFLPVFFVLTWLLLLFASDKIFPPLRASRYFDLNAAIKNTCYLDPKRHNCPKTLEQLIAIEPEKFTKFKNECQLTYRYYENTNEYTLIVRDSPNRAVIFDPRLKKVTISGFDFDEVNVCTLGKDSIFNPPNFEGPWNEIGEWEFLSHTRDSFFNFIRELRKLIRPLRADFATSF